MLLVTIPASCINLSKASNLLPSGEGSNPSKNMERSWPPNVPVYTGRLNYSMQFLPSVYFTSFVRQLADKYHNAGCFEPMSIAFAVPVAPVEAFTAPRH